MSRKTHIISGSERTPIEADYVREYFQIWRDSAYKAFGRTYFDELFQYDSNPQTKYFISVDEGLNVVIGGLMLVPPKMGVLDSYRDKDDFNPKDIFSSFHNLKIGEFTGIAVRQAYKGYWS